MSWKRQQTEGVTEISRAGYSMSKNPSNLKNKIQFNHAFAPIQNLNEKVWKSHDPTAFQNGNSNLSPENEKKNSKIYNTRGTQTNENDRGDDGIGSFGSIEEMSMERIDSLIELLSHRKQFLMEGKLKSEIKTTSKAQRNPPTIEMEEQYEMNTTQHHPQLKRSRSYEALVQLEAILETRHRQLMQNGMLEEYDVNIRDKTNIVMTDIQDEIERMHTQLHDSTDQMHSTLGWNDH